MADDLFVLTKAGVVNAIASLGLPDFGDHVYGQMSPDLVNVKFPCVLITNEGLAERRAPDFEDTEFRAYVYPFRCWIVDRASGQQQKNETPFLNARGAILDLFDDQYLASVPAIRKIEVLFGMTFGDLNLLNSADPKYQYLHSDLMLECTGRKPRNDNGP